MRTLHDDGRVVVDAWQLLEGGPVEGSLPEGDVLLSLAAWRALGDAGKGHNGRIGIWLENTDEPESLEPDVLAAPLLAVRFPAFNDGRGLSSAVLLRTRRGYTGELRAIGDVQLDQLNYMCRCGFDSFALRDGDDAEAMRERLVVMSEYYQPSVREPRPLFRRR
jgi:uncharacterized protein (DUF934 family)